MEVVFTATAIGDLGYWKKSGNKIIQNRITKLLKSIQRTPFECIGKPEALKHNFSGCWSRRINNEHRLIYKVSNDRITVLSLKDHY